MAALCKVTFVMMCSCCLQVSAWCSRQRHQDAEDQSFQREAEHLRTANRVHGSYSQSGIPDVLCLKIGSESCVESGQRDSCSHPGMWACGEEHQADEVLLHHLQPDRVQQLFLHLVLGAQGAVDPLLPQLHLSLSPSQWRVTSLQAARLRGLTVQDRTGRQSRAKNMQHCLVCLWRSKNFLKSLSCLWGADWPGMRWGVDDDGGSMYRFLPYNCRSLYRMRLTQVSK